MFVKVFTLLTLYVVLSDAGCIDSASVSIGRCQVYLKCHRGQLELTKCSAGYFFDGSVSSCVLGAADKNCHFKYMDILLSGNKERTNSGKNKLNIGGEPTENNYWTGTDGSGVTGTQWPFHEETTNVDYWTGTGEQGGTGSVWTGQQVTTEDDFWPGTAATGSGTEWIYPQSGSTRAVRWKRAQQVDPARTTENSYWTGTDGTMATATEWPLDKSTTPGSYWTGTDSTDATATDWPRPQSTTSGNYWTGTDGTAQTATDWPAYSSTHNNPPSKGTEAPMTEVTGSVTQPFVTQTVSGYTDITWTESPTVESTKHETKRPPSKPTTKTSSKPTTSTPRTESTATDWTVTDKTMVTGTQWTVTEPSNDTAAQWPVKRH